MTDPENNHSPGKGYRPFYRRGFFLVALLLLFCGWTGIRIHGRSALKKINARLDSYAAAGFPVHMSQVPEYMNRRHPEAQEKCKKMFAAAFAGRNSLIVTEEFAEKVKGLPFLDMVEGDKLFDTPETLARARIFIAEQASWLEILRQFGNCKHWQPQSCQGLDTFSFIRLPYLTAIPQAVATSCLAAAVSLEDGDRNAAMDFILLAYRINTQLLNEPFLVNVISAISGERILMRSVSKMFDFELCAADELESLQSLTFMIKAENLHDAILLERLSGLDCFYFRNRYTERDNLQGINYMSSLPLFLACRRTHEYLDTMNAAAAIFKQNESQRLNSAALIQDYISDTACRRNPLLSLVPPVNYMVNSYHNYLEAKAEFSQKLENAAKTLAATPPNHDQL